MHPIACYTAILPDAMDAIAPFLSLHAWICRDKGFLSFCRQVYVFLPYTTLEVIINIRVCFALRYVLIFLSIHKPLNHFIRNLIYPVIVIAKSRIISFYFIINNRPSSLRIAFTLAYFIADRESATTDNPAIPQASVRRISTS